MMKYAFLIFGIAFGFFLSRAGATSQDYYAQLFLFENLQLLWVIAAAVTVGIIGIALMRWIYPYALIDNTPLRFEGKPMRKGIVLGSLMFGIGWGLTGTCPGSAPAMLGEGKVMAMFAISGIIMGTYLYGRVASARGHTEDGTVAVSPLHPVADTR